jgi:sulfopyruvate decarboxylase subunit beta
MKRIEAIEKLAGMLKNEIVLTSIGGVNTELFARGDRDLNLYVSTNMGSAAAMGVGLALALPSEKVVVLEGDGSVLLSLGSLVAMGDQQPSNLVLIVFDNECYEAPGEYPSATSRNANLEMFGFASGIEKSLTVRSMEEFEKAFKEALTARGPQLLVAKVERGRPPLEPLGIDGIENKYRFLRALEKRGLITGWTEWDHRKRV